METKVTALVVTSLFFCSIQAHARSATWDQRPKSNEWTSVANWTPRTVPDGPTDVATFATSDVTDISVSVTVTVDGIVFAAGASAYTILVKPNINLQPGDGGIVNNSGVLQQIIVGVAKNGEMPSFLNVDGSGVLDDMVSVTMEGGRITWGSSLIFNDQSSAGKAILHSRGGGLTTESWGGMIRFTDESTAAYATLSSRGGRIVGAQGGTIQFTSNSDAGNAMLIANGSAVDPDYGGGFVSFADQANLDNATVIANDGTNGGAGGQIYFSGYQARTQNTARFEVFGKAVMWAEQAKVPLDIGSLEGDGTVELGSGSLTTGRNGRSTVFSGTLSGDSAGSLVKIGAGTFTLSGDNSGYLGQTTVSEGVLLVNNATGSATGTGTVQVDAGTLGGKGIIAGATTIGTGSGAGAFLAPSVDAKQQAALTIQNSLTFNSDSTYTCTLRANKTTSQTDEVIANGVIISSGAQFNFSGQVQGKLDSGTSFTVISNTSANLITGTFSNLADGAVVSVGRDQLVASYEGGDGNDLTLTVQ